MRQKYFIDFGYEAETREGSGSVSQDWRWTRSFTHPWFLPVVVHLLAQFEGEK
jgi:hypothetical protein